jgi:hypothetical protein
MSAELHESRYICREEFLRRKVGQVEFNWERAPKIDLLTYTAVGVAALSASVVAFTFFPELGHQTFSGTVDYVQNEIRLSITEPFEKIMLALE